MTFEEFKKALWDAANKLRGAVSAVDANRKLTIF